MQRPTAPMTSNGQGSAASSSSLHKVKACYECGSTSHLKYNCPELVAHVRCYHCKELGHRKNDCDEFIAADLALCDPTGPDYIFNGTDVFWGYEC